MFSPASERNKEPIREVLSPKLPASGQLLELACGSLQHAVHIAPHHPNIVWQPTDINPDALSHGSVIELPSNVRAPVYLDVLTETWSVEQVDVIYSANLLHISPFQVTSALFEGAYRIGVQDVFIYGPFFMQDQPPAEGNVLFDADLRARNLEWGIRKLEDVEAVALQAGFRLNDIVHMPANNLFLHLRCAGEGQQT